MKPTLRVETLDKRFGRRELLRGIGLELNAGQAVLLSGPNGAGKTTLLRILSGLERPDRCRLDVGRGTLSWRQNREALLRNTLYLHQHPYMFDGSVRYNLAYALARNLPRRRRDELIDTAIAWAGLEHLQDTPAKRLSGGERQRVSLARAWLRQPRILLLDKPTTNLDQASRQRTLELLAPFKQGGMSLIVASHDVHHFSSLTDRSLHLHEGRLIEVEPMQVRPMPATEISASMGNLA
jgi:tungstate transport system ATP-binding protein